MRTNPTNRPTFADLVPMFADAVQNHSAMNDEETANELLARIGDFAEELALTSIPTNHLCTLMEIVSEYAVTAQTITQQGKANTAAEALQQITAIWGLLKDYRPELWQFSYAVTSYTKAIADANLASYKQLTEAAATSHRDATQSHETKRRPVAPRSDETATEATEKAHRG